MTLLAHVFSISEVAGVSPTVGTCKSCRGEWGEVRAPRYFGGVPNEGMAEEGGQGYSAGFLEWWAMVKAVRTQLCAEHVRGSFVSISPSAFDCCTGRCPVIILWDSLVFCGIRKIRCVLPSNVTCIYLGIVPRMPDRALAAWASTRGEV